MIASGDKVRKFYSHSVKGKTTSEWQGLHDHLLNIASLAKEFAEVFNSGDWAYVAGLWHDVLKKWVEWNKISKKQSRGI